jgi:hypothetical protein
MIHPGAEVYLCYCAEQNMPAGGPGVGVPSILQGF